jgi:hypothetical protein
MSCVIVLTPVVIAAWPVLAAAVAAAATSAGFRVTKQAAVAAAARATSKVELEVENADVVEDTLRAGQSIVVERDGVRVTFSRDERGRMKTCVEGSLPKAELRAIGEDLSGRVVQQYVYRRLQDELGKRGFTTLAEEKGPDESIRVHVRRFEG